MPHSASHRSSRARGPLLLAAILLLAVIAPSVTDALAAGAGAQAPAVGQTPADLLLRNGAVYTVDAERSWAEAVAVANGRIVWVGDDAGADAWIGPGTDVLDLDGKMVLPGFHDSHVHPVSGGIEIGECDLNDAADRDEIVAMVRNCAAASSAPRGAAGAAGGGSGNTAWIRGGGWQLPIFPNANPRKELLDEIAPGRPVYLSAADGHSAWVSSRALEIAGITAATPDPPGGRIERDPDTGEPTGTLREAATRLVSRHLPPYDLSHHVAGLFRAQQLANRLGITSVIEANADPPTLRAYAELDRRGELDLRVRVSLQVEPSEGLAQVPALVRVRNAYRGDRLRADTVKIFADGVIESHTAALLQPYTGLDHRGELNVPPRALDDLVMALDRARFQIHVHAIGDRAIRVALDAIETARRGNGPRDARHLLAHIQLFHRLDIGRFADLGVIAAVQPLWAYADTYITELTEPVLGPERSRWLYPFGSLAASGAVLACGSDWTVSSMNPLEGMQVAITRVEPGAGGEPWIPEERIDLPAAIACYTINGAYASFQEDRTGSIEVGKLADLAVLDKNLFELPADRIHTAKVVLTLIEGDVVWRDEIVPLGS